MVLTTIGDIITGAWLSVVLGTCAYCIIEILYIKRN